MTFGPTNVVAQTSNVWSLLHSEFFLKHQCLLYRREWEPIFPYFDHVSRYEYCLFVEKVDPFGRGETTLKGRGEGVNTLGRVHRNLFVVYFACLGLGMRVIDGCFGIYVA